MVRKVTLSSSNVVDATPSVRYHAKVVEHVKEWDLGVFLSQCEYDLFKEKKMITRLGMK